MKKVYVMILIGLLCFSIFQFVHFASSASGAPAVEWSKTFAGATAYGPIVIQTSDGGYAIASTGDFGSGEVWCLVKTNSTGTVEWNKTYAGIPPNLAESLIQTSDGGYAIAGVTNHNPYGNAWLVKTDSNGNIQWNQTYSDGSWTGVWSLVQTNDNGYVMSGNKDYYTGWLIKTDSSGTKQWSKGFGVGNNTQLTSVVQTSDGGYVATGATQFPRFSGKVDAYLVKTDSDGNTVWIKDFSRTTGDDFGRSVIQTSDGGYAIVGETDHFGNADFWLIKTDASGNYLWDKTFGGIGWDGATSIVQTTDGGYALAGQTNSFGAGGNDFWLVKTGADGTMQWNSTYGGAGDDVGTHVTQTRDGGYVLCGYTDSFNGDGSYEVWLIKLKGSARAPTVKWNRTYGGTGEESMFMGSRSVVETSDGGYAVVGRSASVVGVPMVLLVKTDSSGYMQWNRTYGRQELPNGDLASAVIQTSDGGYALAGASWNQTREAHDLFLVKTDAGGNMQWNLTYIRGTSGGSLDWGHAFSVIQTNDGGYMVGGSVRHHPDHPTGDWDGWLVKTDESGNVTWDKSYGGDSDEGVHEVLQTGDGGYIFVGTTLSYGSGSGDVWLVKTDGSGNQQWAKTFGGSNWEDGNSIAKTSDGGYIIGAATSSFGVGSWDFWLIKTDVNGNQQWNKTFGGANEDIAWSVIETTDSGYALAGSTKSFGAGDSDFWMLKTDPLGKQEWNTTFGGANYDDARSIFQTVDKGYAVAGYTNSFGAGSYDFLLIKLAGTEPRTWIVDDDGPADFHTIQEAINAASDGDTVFVKTGVYSEPIQINKVLTLLGENRSATFIKDWYIGVYANNVSISNFTIENLWADSPSGAGGCVYILGFDNLTFSDNTYVHNYQAIRLIQTSGDLIINNYIDGSSQGGTFGGIGFDYVNNTIMRNNKITNCGQALSLSLPNYNNTILENTITGNDFGIVMNNLLTGNKFYHNNIINNNKQVYTYYIFQAVNDAWDNGYPSGGNYWSDYNGTDLYSGPYQNVSGSDGIGDTSYTIVQQNLDHYPLMNEFPPPSESVAPVADFAYSPLTPIVDETVTFDASTSKNGWNGTQSVAISTYAWDFGDNSKTTGQVATHAYVMPGNFSVTLNVTDAQGLWNVTQEQIQVGQPHNPSAAFTINPEFTYVDQEFTLNASASLPGWNGTHENLITSFIWDFGDENVTSSVSATIVHSYANAGNFNVTLTVSDSENRNSSCSHRILAMMPTSMSISTSATSSVIGYVVNINGALSDFHGNPIGNEPVVLYYTFPGTTNLFALTSSTTDDNGQYNVQWIPTATGTYCLIAEWIGNMTYSGARNNVTMSCLYAMTQYILSVESNSTISALAFNATSVELSFTASGPSGTSGYLKVTIAKSLIANITNVEVHLDNNLIEFSVTSAGNSWILSFNYSHSSHNVRIDLVSRRIGDITGPGGQPDGKCDMRDIGLVARNFGRTVPPGPANCDLTGMTAGVPDGIIDMRDIGLVAKHYGERYQ